MATENRSALLRAGAVVLTSVISAGACSGSSSQVTTKPKPTPSVSSASPTPSPSTSPDGAGYIDYLHQHGIPETADNKTLIHLGTTFVCASYRAQETTKQIITIARQNHLKPLRLLPVVMAGSVRYLCPVYRDQFQAPAH